MPADEQQGQSERSTLRDTVESVWVAIILAFVLRAFMVEAFVIPTGSMAPRLMGMHWQLQCPACGWRYSFGCDAEDGPLDSDTIPPYAYCPNCGMHYSGMPVKVTGGDRVLVLKYVYNFNEPQPYDVVVFKNPQNNRENYIKRLIGLPGETIRIVHGDIFVNTAEANGTWKIRRKPPVAQEAMWQIINDNDYQPDAKMMVQNGLDSYPRWRAQAGLQNIEFAGGGRQVDYDGKAPARLEFRTSPEAFLSENAYNAQNEHKYTHGIEGHLSEEQARNLCGDLKLSCVFFPKSADSKIKLHLTSMGCNFAAELTAGGSVKLECENASELSGIWQMTASCPALKPGRGYKVEFCHSDLRVWLTIDGRETLSSTDDLYGGRTDEVDRIITLTKNMIMEVRVPALAISVDGGPSSLRHLTVMRDEYYKDSEVESREIGLYANRIKDLGRPNTWHEMSPDRYAGWGTTDNPISLRKYPDNPDLDEFYVLGDNSPKSKDCRSWTAAAPTLRLYKAGDMDQPIYQLGTVPRYNMLGKAIFVYWPAGYRIPILNWPIIPDVGKMRLIR